MKEKITLTLELSDDVVTQLAASVDFHIKMWPGYPAAEREEQERLWALRSMLKTAMMEIAFHRSDDQSR